MTERAAPSYECEGGDPPCWAHLFEDERHDIADRDDIELLVRTFYRRAAIDGLLGPVFGAANMDWPLHVATLVDFWAWQLLGQPGYEGNPLRSHEPVHARTPLSREHYVQWVALFCGTIDELFVGDMAETAKGRGRKMAAAMERLLAGTSGPGVDPTQPMWRATGTGGS